MSPAEIVFWRDRTEAADARGYFMQEDYRDAGSWKVCAVGEQVKKFPKVVIVALDSADEPRDKVLLRLGLRFNEAVSDSWRLFDDEGIKEDKYILDAYETLDLIEARVMVLKARARHAA